MTMTAADEGRQALRRHIVDRALNARLRYGLYIDAEAILGMLGDPDVTRYPATIAFDAAALRPGEFACVLPRGARPSDGYRVVLHPRFERQPDLLPLLIAYYIPDINYGDAVTAAEAELFGATLLGLEVDAYYEALCELADSL
ncbi:MAG: hypothetical protein ACYTGG_07520 [Planctomycetota bacterium]|jgi:hypothetical protein